MDLSTIASVVGAALMIGSPASLFWWHWLVAGHRTLVDGVVVRTEGRDGSTARKGPKYLVIRPGRRAARYRDAEKEVFGPAGAVGSMMGLYAEHGVAPRR